MAKPVQNRFPKYWILLGTVLPDLWDKPLFFSLSFINDHDWMDLTPVLEIISGTRSFGHTLLFPILLVSISLGLVQKNAQILMALAVGVLTHIFLDGVQAYVGNSVVHQQYYLNTVFWPRFSWSFMPFLYPKKIHYFQSKRDSFLMWAEAIGFILFIIQMQPWLRWAKTGILNRFRKVPS